MNRCTLGVLFPAARRDAPEEKRRGRGTLELELELGAGRGGTTVMPDMMLSPRRRGARATGMTAGISVCRQSSLTAREVQGHPAGEVRRTRGCGDGGS